MKISVFTPTYNRGYLIENLYKSLKEQTFSDFEWIVVDDGSSDNTEELFMKFSEEKTQFPIYYEKVENGGKHRAINRGLKKASGELFYIVDSDDTLPPDAMQKIAEVENTIPIDEKNKFAGVCGVKAFSTENMIGTTFNGDYLDITSLQRSQYGIAGDKAEVFYTDILRKYPFPEFNGENFITECVVWDKIAYDGYKLRFFNDIVYLAEYLDDGLSKNFCDYYQNNPKGYGLYIYQSVKFGKFNKNRAKHETINYLKINHVRYSYFKLADFLHCSIFTLFPYIIEIHDLKHFPNRLFIKIFGENIYEKIINIFRSKK